MTRGNALDALYDPLLVEHGKNPRHAQLPDAADAFAEADNPLCGDRVRVGLRWAAQPLQTRRIASVGHDTVGCALCVASASIMAQRVQGLPIEDAVKLADELDAWLAAGPDAAPEPSAELRALSAVARFPMRRRCVSLPWDVLRLACREV